MISHVTSNFNLILLIKLLIYEYIYHFKDEHIINLILKISQYTDALSSNINEIWQIK